MRHRTTFQLAQGLRDAQLERRFAELFPVERVGARYSRAKWLEDTYSSVLASRLDTPLRTVQA